MLACIGMLGACSSSTDASKEVVIGAVLPLTGPAADLGQHSKDGIDLYAASVNEKGGVDIGGTKRKVKIVYCDTQYEAAKATSCGRKLANEDHVVGIVTVTTKETLPLYAFNSKVDSEFIIISSAATDKIVNSGNKYAARYWFNTKTYMPGVGKTFKKADNELNLGIKKIGILTSEDEFGTSWADNFTKGVEGAGYAPPRISSYQQGTSDLYPQLTPLVSSDIDILALPLTCDQASLAVKQARELGFKGRFMFMLACDAGDLKSKLSNPDDVKGVFFESGPWNSPDAPDKNFRTEFSAKFPGKPFNPSASTTYSQVSWLVESAVKARSTDVKKMRAAMPSALKSSANTLGLKDMQDNGETTGTVHIRFVKGDGTYQEIS